MVCVEVVLFFVVELVGCEVLVWVVGCDCVFDLLIEDIVVDLVECFYVIICVVGGW